MPAAPQGRRRLAAGVLSGLTGVCLVGTTALPTSADPQQPEYLGSAADFGITPPTVDDTSVDLSESAIEGRWLVQVDSAPRVAGGSAKAADRARSAVVQAARADGVDVKVDRAFEAGWTGFSAHVADRDVEALRNVAGVVGVFPVVEVERPTTSAEPQMDYAVAMTGADVAQTELGLSGKGVKVGVIDTGIDYNHPDLGGSGTNDEAVDFPNDRVVAGYDFVGDDYDASGENGTPNPVPDEFPDDCNGHGTHVAGIVGASGEITGVAPEADLGAYRVFGCEGSSDSEIILAAMEQAFEDGMDVVNMSLGAGFMTWPSYPTAQAADAFTAAGQTYTVSAGNSGTSGTFSGGAPGVAHDVITVASVDNTHFLASTFETAGGLSVAYAEASDAPAAPTSGSLELVSAGPAGSDAARACLADPDADPPIAAAPAPEASAGQALLVERGVCSFHSKALNAQQAGYEAVVIYNNVEGVINATVAGDPPITIPAVTILQADGLALQEEIGDDTTTITWTDEKVAFDNPTGGLMSDFSSYGLAADLTLKPDVAAPGGSINSTYPLENGEYASLSGTSMAAPHAAGAAALLLEARPDLEPLDVRTALQNTADQLGWYRAPGAYLEPVHRQGAGLIDIPQAVTTATKVEASKISLGEGEAGPVTTTLTVSNDGAEDVTYELDAFAGIATAGSTSAPGFYGPGTDVTFSADSVTVPAGGSASVDVTIGDPYQTDGVIHGGWLTFSTETDTLSVPFAGMSGDYQALEVLTDGPTGLPLPSLGVVIDGGLYLNDEAGYTYSMVGDDVPYLIHHREYPVSSLAINVYEANEDGEKGKKVHSRFHNWLTLTDLGRTFDPDILAWDGTHQGNNGKGNDKARKVADGDYVLEIEVLRALGDPSNPDHVETWTSPAFTVEWGEGSDTGAGNGPNPGKGKGRP
ncbi:S8 family serine peptidase [Ornithinimicrobium kibberense]|uniref:S8 family serine peptidase n=2 Tax=Ornithinimicrobium kibberense TaxID=282060 RepID=A0ABV5V0T3_9MICO|nr:S8 family serine peptidase [Ornithinimicrobium kibberense]